MSTAARDLEQEEEVGDDPAEFLQNAPPRVSTATGGIRLGSAEQLSGYPGTDLVESRIPDPFFGSKAVQVLLRAAEAA